ncbi:divalent-cation tolerance protein CutA [Crenobacter sp. SG2303]|uniref:Divalent-cation tolerance protein CutA n=1 Tax=Crenobacter oryzisoli TaxID=3056844 RepID=A0ABT7XPK7_9NEIS|nr:MULTISPECIES: divalent-cation tolerance protein CutA [unclassified Crenobacter]MDN0075738.1 divalent-cation tolerance protein CutA [Crenobacter sp. SG2303]MDN0083054.1 divalent-cation tolerance protein CutA [Crenobacter sp. SG2305]
MKISVVLCTVPDAATAERLARTLVEEGLAACVNLLAPCQSVYRWQGQLESASEVPLIIKTTTERYPALEARLVELHPYEVPEILALPVEAGLPSYLTWVGAETNSRG